MLWSLIGKWIVPAAAFLGTSTLTLALIALPELGLGVLAALVGARLVMSLVNWFILYRIAGEWVYWPSRPRLAGAA